MGNWTDDKIVFGAISRQVWTLKNSHLSPKTEENGQMSESKKIQNFPRNVLTIIMI